MIMQFALALPVRPIVVVTISVEGWGTTKLLFPNVGSVPA